MTGRVDSKGEFDKFDPSKGDKLVPGDWRYYEKKGDTKSANQGWNVIYLGKDENGKDQFWKIHGTFTDKNPGKTGSAISGEYLSSAQGTPDTAGLLGIDQNSGASS